jgi:hypothetical protein
LQSLWASAGADTVITTGATRRPTFIPNFAFRLTGQLITIRLAYAALVFIPIGHPFGAFAGRHARHIAFHAGFGIVTGGHPTTRQAFHPMATGACAKIYPWVVPCFLRALAATLAIVTIFSLFTLTILKAIPWIAAFGISYRGTLAIKTNVTSITFAVIRTLVRPWIATAFLVYFHANIPAFAPFALGPAIAIIIGITFVFLCPLTPTAIRAFPTRTVGIRFALARHISGLVPATVFLVGTDVVFALVTFKIEILAVLIRLTGKHRYERPRIGGDSQDTHETTDDNGLGQEVFHFTHFLSFSIDT